MVMRIQVDTSRNLANILICHTVLSIQLFLNRTALTLHNILITSGLSYRLKKRVLFEKGNVEMMPVAYCPSWESPALVMLRWNE
jgi:hypothetical protein